MNDIDFASYADDNTPFIIGEDIGDVIFKLQNASKTLFQSFYDNQMKANPDKRHFIGSSNEEFDIVIEYQTISNSDCEKRLRGCSILNWLSSHTSIAFVEKQD